MGLAYRFNNGPSAQASGAPQQQFQPAGQYQASGQYPAIQQSWQGQPQQYQQAPQGYQQPYGGQPGYQQANYQQPAYPQQSYQQTTYQQGYQPPAQQWQQPQQGYAQPQGHQQQPLQQVQPAGSVKPALNDQGIQTVLHNQLNNIIRVNRLEAFYPPQKLQQVQDHVARVDFRLTPSLMLFLHDFNNTSSK